MRLRHAAELANGGNAPPGAVRDGTAFDAEAAIPRTATSAGRQRLLALQADGTIGDAAFPQVEQELDLEEHGSPWIEAIAP